MPTALKARRAGLNHEWTQLQATDASHGPKRRGKIKNFAQLRPGQATEQWRELGELTSRFERSGRACDYWRLLLFVAPSRCFVFVIARRHFVARIASRLEVDAGEAEWESVGIILAPDKRYHNLMCYYSVLSVEVLRVSLHVHTSILYIHTTCILPLSFTARRDGNTTKCLLSSLSQPQYGSLLLAICISARWYPGR